MRVGEKKKVVVDLPGNGPNWSGTAGLGNGQNNPEWYSDKEGAEELVSKIDAFERLKLQ